MIVIEVTDLNVVSIYLSVGSKARARLLVTFCFPASVTADLRDNFRSDLIRRGGEFTLACIVEREATANEDIASRRVVVAIPFVSGKTAGPEQSRTLL